MKNNGRQKLKNYHSKQETPKKIFLNNNTVISRQEIQDKTNKRFIPNNCLKKHLGNPQPPQNIQTHFDGLVKIVVETDKEF